MNDDVTGFEPQRRHRLEIVWVPITDVQQHPENANNGDVDAIAESIQVNGVFDACKVQRSTGNILAGNHTYLAQLREGAKILPVIFLDVDDEEAKRILLAANQTARKSMDDEAQLLNLLDDLRGTDLGISGTGFEYRDLEYLDTLMREPLALADVPTEPLTSGLEHERDKRGGRLDFTINPTVSEDGTCESITLARPNFRHITAVDFNALLRALGKETLSPAKLAEYGVPAWE